MANKGIISETSIEKSLVRKVHAVGGWAIKLSPAWDGGIPDRLCLFPGGRLVFVELKQPGKLPRPLQLAEHERLKGLGFPVVVVDSTPDVNELIRSYGTDGRTGYAPLSD